MIRTYVLDFEGVEGMLRFADIPTTLYKLEGKQSEINPPPKKKTIHRFALGVGVAVSSSSLEISMAMVWPLFLTCGRGELRKEPGSTGSALIFAFGDPM